MEKIGDRIRRERILKGWKRPDVVRELAELNISLSAEAIRLYEINRTYPSRDVRAGLAKVFGKDESYLEFGRSLKPAKAEELSGKELQILSGYRESIPEVQEIIEAIIIIGRRKPAFKSGRK